MEARVRQGAPYTYCTEYSDLRINLRRYDVFIGSQSVPVSLSSDNKFNLRVYISTIPQISWAILT
jgi:hypothetical protein